MDQLFAKLWKKPNLTRQMEQVYRFDQARQSQSDYSELLQNLGTYMMLGICALMWLLPYHENAGRLYRWIYPQLNSSAAGVSVFPFLLEAMALSFMLSNQLHVNEGNRKNTILSKLKDTPVDAAIFLYTRYKKVTILLVKITVLFTIEQSLITLIAYKGAYLLNILMPVVYALFINLFLVLSVFIPKYISFKRSNS